MWFILTLFGRKQREEEEHLDNERREALKKQREEEDKQDREKREHEREELR